MKKLVLILSALLFLIGTTDVQAHWGKKLLKKAGESAKRATERNVEKKIDKAVDKTFDSAEDAVTGKGNDKKDNTATDVDDNTDADGQDVEQDGGQQKGQSLEMTYAKSDFVPGDEIIFEDLVDNEQLGEFPSKWDLLGGNCEIATVGGVKVISFDRSTSITPLMKDAKNYLTESHTVEFDFYVPEKGGGWWKFAFRKPSSNDFISHAEWYVQASNERVIEADWVTPSKESRTSNIKIDLSAVGWHKCQMSFNKRAWKVYIDGVRVTNAPNVVQPGWFYIEAVTSESMGKYFLKNVRIAKGAVPLYDRMMSDGKFITYGITFDVGKSTIKPESMGEINRIVTLMKENPDLKFSVEGHTDSTGNEASNQTLSEARSKAIVDKLIELGIATDRLTASGKGQSSPIADNGTDEGRAKNRRVEFVKL